MAKVKLSEVFELAHKLVTENNLYFACFALARASSILTKYEDWQTVFHQAIKVFDRFKPLIPYGEMEGVSPNMEDAWWNYHDPARAEALLQARDYALSIGD